LNPLTQRMIWLIDCWSVHISSLEGSWRRISPTFSSSLSQPTIPLSCKWWT
jgi:hypothetical protein